MTTHDDIKFLLEVGRWSQTASEIPDLNPDSDPHDVHVVLKTIVDRLVPYLRHRAASRNKVFNIADGPGVNLSTFTGDEKYDGIRVHLVDGYDPARPNALAICATKGFGQNIKCDVYVYNCLDMNIIASHQFLMVVTHELTHALQSYFRIHDKVGATPITAMKSGPEQDKQILNSDKEVQAYIQGFLAHFAITNVRKDGHFTLSQFWSWMEDTYYDYPFMVHMTQTTKRIADEMLLRFFARDANAVHHDTVHIPPQIPSRPTQSVPPKPINMRRGGEYTPDLRAPTVRIGRGLVKKAEPTKHEIGAFLPGDEVVVIGLNAEHLMAIVLTVSGKFAKVRLDHDGSVKKVPVANLRASE